MVSSLTNTQAPTRKKDSDTMSKLLKDLEKTRGSIANNSEEGVSVYEV